MAGKIIALNVEHNFKKYPKLKKTSQKIERYCVFVT